MVFLAGHDSVVDAADQKWLEHRLGSNARIVIFPDAGHNLQRTHFDEFVNNVEAFLATS